MPRLTNLLSIAATISVLLAVTASGAQSVSTAAARLEADLLNLRDSAEALASDFESLDAFRVAVDEMYLVLVAHRMLIDSSDATQDEVRGSRQSVVRAAENVRRRIGHVSLASSGTNISSMLIDLRTVAESGG